MGHILRKIYAENEYSWVVECSCGWKEKGVYEASARGRFNDHQARPHMTPTVR